MTGDDTRKAGRVVAITGGGRGLGQALAKVFSAQGDRVVIIGRSAQTLESAAAELGDSILALQADISDPDDVRRAFEQIAQHHGALDILINNAAVFPLFKVEDADDEELRLPVDINLLGPLHCIRSAIPMMRTRGGGMIANVSSDSVTGPFPFLSVYAATKAALEALSDGLRSELRDDNIRVMKFRVGPMDSGSINREGWTPDRTKAFFKLVEERGLLKGHGPSMSIEFVATALRDVLALPPSLSPELFVLRPH